MLLGKCTGKNGDLKMIISKLTDFIQVKKYYLLLLNQLKYMHLYQENTL